MKLWAEVPQADRATWAEIATSHAGSSDPGWRKRNLTRLMAPACKAAVQWPNKKWHPCGNKPTGNTAFCANHWRVARGEKREWCDGEARNPIHLTYSRYDREHGRMMATCSACGGSYYYFAKTGRLQHHVNGRVSA